MISIFVAFAFQVFAEEALLNCRSTAPNKEWKIRLDSKYIHASKGHLVRLRLRAFKRNENVAHTDTMSFNVYRKVYRENLKGLVRIMTAEALKDQLDREGLPTFDPKDWIHGQDGMVRFKRVGKREHIVFAKGSDTELYPLAFHFSSKLGNVAGGCKEF